MPQLADAPKHGVTTMERISVILRARTAACVVAVLVAAAMSQVGAISDARPASVPSPNAAEEARVDRGAALRKVLLATLEEAYGHDGIWPGRLAPARAGRPDLVYIKPDKIADVAQAREVARATVVLHEQLNQHPGGVWVGYADGHMEFAASTADLAACVGQLPIVRANIAKYGDWLGPELEKLVDPKTVAAQLAGQLTLCFVDPKGRPVVGARVGYRGWFGGDYTPEERVRPYTEDNVPLSSDSNGRVVLPAELVFNHAGIRYGWSYLSYGAAPLWALRDSDSLVALDELYLPDFVGGKTRQIQLQPACELSCRITSVGLRDLGLAMGITEGFVARPGQGYIRALLSTSDVQQLDFLVPPGEYNLRIDTHLCDLAWRYVHISPGQRKLNLQIDLQPRLLYRMYGRPAPELREIKGWKNGGPLTLANLRGKLVLLDFWGYWCGPCVGSMPALMKLYDQFKDKGLVIIAVHDDSVDSIAEMDQKLTGVRQKLWQGRDLPFLVALDGGGQTRIKYSASLTSGATTAAYGIVAFPTSVLIGRDGTVLRAFHVRDPNASDELTKLLTPVGK
ncbi:MAG: TlpA disulfide reductase family protein [Tepidisphaeraceae bacterium]|jgi:thiol-disulfide isomerase/thioredoxin